MNQPSYKLKLLGEETQIICMKHVPLCNLNLNLWT